MVFDLLNHIKKNRQGHATRREKIRFEIKFVSDGMIPEQKMMIIQSLIQFWKLNFSLYACMSQCVPSCAASFTSFRIVSSLRQWNKNKNNIYTRLTTLIKAHGENEMGKISKLSKNKRKKYERNCFTFFFSLVSQYFCFTYDTLNIRRVEQNKNEIFCLVIRNVERKLC